MLVINMAKFNQLVENLGKGMITDDTDGLITIVERVIPAMHFAMITPVILPC